IPNNMFSNPQRSSPFANVHHTTIVFDESLACWLTAFAAVVVLLFRRCPSNIRWFVVTFVVDAIERVFGGWFMSQAFYKFFKGRESELNPTTTVVSPHTRVWISASMFCLMIGVVLGGTFPSVFTTCLPKSDSHLTSEASTGFSLPCDKCMTEQLSDN